MKRSVALTLCCFALFASACRREKTTSASPGAPVILISIDTLRADHLPMFGYRDVETPNLDALRRDGMLFTSAYAQVPLTLPSHTTVLTGLLPYHHGVRNNIGYHLASSVTTIPSILRPAGYASGAAVSAYVLRGSTGLRDSFDFYDDAIENQPGTAIGSLARAGGDTARIASDWIGRNEAKPFFFFLHLFEPHSPYEPQEPYRSRFRLPYDGEIATADAIVGKFIDDLKSRGIYDRALIIFFSDHGEGLSQHGEPEHGIFLYREAIHVPLVVKLPRSARAGETVAAPVSLADILPTIAAVTGVKAPKVDGTSLLATLPPQRNVYSETLYPRIHLGWSDLRSLTGERFQFIQAPRPELYDVVADPAETKNVLTDQRRVYSAMRAELDKHNATVEMPSNIDPEEAKKLAALGYLSATPAASTGPLPDPKDRIGDIAEMGRASDLARAGRTAEAVARFRAILATNPNFADAWNQLAHTLEQAGRDEEAAAAYRDAIRRSPSLSGEFALSLGSILLRLGELDDAAKHAELAMKTDPSGAHVLLARVAFARKDYPRAAREATEARRDPTAFAGATVLLAEAASAQERPAEALALCEEAARHAGGAPIESLDSARGDALARLGRYDEAAAALRRNIAAFPNDRSAYVRLAIVYAVQQQPDAARAALSELIRRNPGPGAKAMAEKTARELGL